VTEQDDPPERWYNAQDEMEQFYSALWTATASFRKANRGPRFAIDRPLLWRFIENHGGLHERGTWLRIESVLPGHDYVVIKQRQSDGTDTIFNLTAVETLEVIGWTQ
jgi:hypothetical protein